MAVPSVLRVLRPKKIPTYIEHGRTKRTNVLRPKKYQHTWEHGRTKRTNVLRPKKYQHCIANVVMFATGDVFKMLVFYSVLVPVRNIPKFKDRANWSRDTFQPMRRRACVYQQTNQNIAAVIKYFQNSGRSRTESVVVSRLSGIF